MDNEFANNFYKIGGLFCMNLRRATVSLAYVSAVSTKKMCKTSVYTLVNGNI